MREPIIVEVYEARRLLKKIWRWRIIAANGRKAGHQYNSLDKALEGARFPFDGRPVFLRVRYLDGRLVDQGQLR